MSAPIDPPPPGTLAANMAELHRACDELRDQTKKTVRDLLIDRVTIVVILVVYSLLAVAGIVLLVTDWPFS